MIAPLLGLVALLVGTMFFSAAEIAVTMASRVRLRTRAEQGKAGARRAEQLLAHPERAIATCLVGITLVSVAIAAYGRGLVLRLHPLPDAATDVVSGLVFVPLVLVLGETLPKALAQTYPNRTLAALALPLEIVRVLLWPLTQLSFGVSAAVRRLARVQSGLLEFLSREELKQFVAHSEKHGHVDADERDLIYRIFEFWRLDPARFVRRLDAVRRLSADVRVGEAQEFMREHHVARLVVTDAGGLEVLGIATATGLLAAPRGAVLGEFLQPPVRARLDEGVDRLLAALQRSPSQIAVVRNGDATGIVVLDDLLGELLGRAPRSAAAGKGPS